MFFEREFHYDTCAHLDVIRLTGYAMLGSIN